MINWLIDRDWPMAIMVINPSYLIWGVPWFLAHDFDDMDGFKGKKSIKNSLYENPNMVISIYGLMMNNDV